MLINLSNHPLCQWSAKQIKAAEKKYNTIIDFPFPHISPVASKSVIIKKSKSYAAKCHKLISASTEKHNAVHVMGELTFTFSIVNFLKQKAILCIASTSNRIVLQESEAKTSYFSFVTFREY